MFLQQLYQQWKKMFYLLLALVAMQFFFMFKAVETIPFFLYNMYSTRQRNGDSAAFTAIYLNGRLFNTSRLSGHEQETLLGSLSYFKKLKKRRFFATDSITVASRLKGRLPAAWYGLAYRRLTNTQVNDRLFFDWWRRYAEQVSGAPVDSFSIIESTVIWRPHYQVRNDTVSLIKYKRGQPSN